MSSAIPLYTYICTSNCYRIGIYVHNNRKKIFRSGSRSPRILISFACICVQSNVLFTQARRTYLKHCISMHCVSRHFTYLDSHQHQHQRHFAEAASSLVIKQKIISVGLWVLSSQTWQLTGTGGNLIRGLPVERSVDYFSLHTYMLWWRTSSLCHRWILRTTF